jgi:hypothetical protein
MRSRCQLPAATNSTTAAAVNAAKPMRIGQRLRDVPASTVEPRASAWLGWSKLTLAWNPCGGPRIDA